MPFKHITAEDRSAITTLLNEQRTPAYIARRIGVNRSTISREIKRNQIKPKPVQLAQTPPRPAIVIKRTRLGDLEGDTIVGLDQKDRIATYVDRASGECNLGLVLGYDAGRIAILTAQTVKRSPVVTHTITYDRGNEFAEYDDWLAKRKLRSTSPTPMLLGSVGQTKTLTDWSGNTSQSGVTLKPLLRGR